MKQRPIGMLLVLLLLVAASGARADEKGVRRELQAIYDRTAQGWKNRDPRAIQAPLAPDYLGRSADGTTETREQSEAAARALLHITRSVKQISFRVVDVALRDGQATAVVIGKAAAVATDPTGREHAVTFYEVGQDTWRQAPTGWTLRQAQSWKREWTVDGMPSDLSELLGAQPPTAEAGATAGDAALRRELQAFYDRQIQAQRDNDAAAFLNPAFLTPEYTEVHLDGRTLNREQALAHYRKVWGTIKAYNRGSARIGKLTVRGSEVSAISTWKADLVTLDPQEKERNLVFHEVWQDTWRKMAGGWKLQRVEALALEMTVDGQEVDPSDPFGAPLKNGAADAGAVQAEAVRAELQGQYDRMARGWKEKDLGTLIAVLAPDYTNQQLQGASLNREQYEALTRGILGSIRSLDTSSFSVNEAVLRGDEATTHIAYMLSGIILDPQGKEHPATYRGSGREIWRRTAAGWKLRRSEDLSLEMTIDGKRVDPSNPFGRP